jgi:short-subunit dehydrogenase
MVLFSLPFAALVCLFSVPTLFWLLTYFVPILLNTLRPVPNLKKKYAASWALVTGGSSGIGFAIVKRLAEQGLNVVIVAIDDALLKTSSEQLKRDYPETQFRFVGAAFSPGVDYLEKIIQATNDIDVQIIFNNAGYIVTR